MAKFCSKCGNAVNETDNVCSKCGNVLNPNANANANANANTYNPNPNPVQPAQVVVAKPKIPGRGFGIAALVLGIISLIATIAHFGTIMDVLSTADAFSGYTYLRIDVSAALQSIIPTLCIWIVGSILAVAFAFIAKSRNFKNKVSTSGLVLGIIAFVMSMVDLITICVNL